MSKQPDFSWHQKDQERKDAFVIWSTGRFRVSLLCSQIDMWLQHKQTFLIRSGASSNATTSQAWGEVYAYSVPQDFPSGLELMVQHFNCFQQQQIESCPRSAYGPCNHSLSVQTVLLTHLKCILSLIWDIWRCQAWAMKRQHVQQHVCYQRWLSTCTKNY